MKSAVYDCFSFYNELDLLEIRLNVLNDVVDKFVLLEARQTHMGKPKPLYFQENKERFAGFKDKIIHVVVDFPDFEDKTDIARPWYRENYQRNYISTALTDCQDEDVIIISDLDEIPDPKAVLRYKNLPGIKALMLNPFYFYLNNFAYGSKWIHGSRMLSLADFKGILDDCTVNYGACLPLDVNQGTTATKIRFYSGKKRRDFLSTGWHFSHLGGEQKVREKMYNYAHYNDWKDLDDNEGIAINKWIRSAYSIKELRIVEIDESYPQYILENQEKYRHLILSVERKGKETSRVIAASWRRILAQEFLEKLLKIIKKIIKPFLRLLCCFIPFKSWRQAIRKIYR